MCTGTLQYHSDCTDSLPTLTYFRVSVSCVSSSRASKSKLEDCSVAMTCLYTPYTK